MTKSERIYMNTRIDIKRVIELEGINENGLIKLVANGEILTNNVCKEVEKITCLNHRKAKQNHKLNLITDEQFNLEMAINMMMIKTIRNTEEHINA